MKKYINYSDLNEDTLSIKKEDKISIMRKVKQVYSQVKSNDDQKVLKGYLERYIINSGDDDLISFLNKLNPPAKSIRTDLNIQDKEKYGEVSTTGINATAAYTGTYTGGLAGDWAYNNYNKYSTSFPAFHNNNNYGSDCTNFVSQAMYSGGGMPFQENWYCFMKNPTYLNPTSATELNFSWTLSDPSPWISVKEFRDFWMYKAVGTYYCTKSDYVANHVTQYNKPIRKGDVIVLHKGISDFITVPTHCMIISRYDTVNKDFLLAGHSNERQAHPLLTAIDAYACVEFITF
ncbi:amidase domain-containing protein [Ruminiclostridium papyrosolvens]|uniref:Putative amidase domain-containing protein n=1 Tax=Ruminiclostridium papyrosolvens C7 TaxID=1330534 RepID=U4QX56_9FIRM|nr:amidase domain-containing protein [Ruminiclostridium papyrosolvens]EPR08100.1 hypothetical protein L323_18360 [Ruminiclostridium papyrosolvens C7]